ncbi:rhamnogalacturonan lyase [Muribaculum gordoncarteri]|jgi:rhamnogalacturonan endolyase|uniref:Rhamnogalacturonan lyase n=2 Tax=Muribaculum TaxID=1918540 RepID=A0A4P7VLB5_9BACT|nr:rhamnogalacturonan lyase [Muribaculum gordoncarteri]QCD34465.1 rhamnogalacturonan lyase [Muribaculum gordoncarteri]
MKLKNLLSLMALGAVTLASAQGAYDYSRLQRESLGRGVVAVRENPSTVMVSWRYLSSDPENQAFDVYRNGKKVNSKPITEGTFFKDKNTSDSQAVYTVKPAKGDRAGEFTLPANAPCGYINIALDRPDLGVDPNGREYFYNANDASIGDVDGDGEYEIILKWNPTNSHDNAHDGWTGPTLFDCYKLDGTRLWRIDMGDNIRSGAHYTQFMVYDLDGDGCAEIVMKTADGTMDGQGKVIGDRRADFRNLKGRIIAGPEYLTVFNGKTGEAMATVDYVPQRGQLKDWGDSYANRSERYLAATAYLDGIHPSVVMCRGYYARTVLAAFDWDGKELKNRWTFDSNDPGCEAYAGQGNHNLRVADVDGDGCDEIIYGQMTVDNDGKGLYSTGMYHGDALHLVSDVDNEKYYVWGCHENRKDGTSLRDARTGKVVFQFPSDKDIGRCMAADIDPNHEGVELWSPNTEGVRAFDGSLISPQSEFIGETKASVPVNMAVWWDGDLLRELLDRNEISKYNWGNGNCDTLMTMEGCTWNNGTKANPCLQGDIVGDWREEVLMRTDDNQNLRLYVTTIPTEYRFHTFLEDPVYRVSIANQNVAYNQPTGTGFYFGPDLKKGSKFRGTTIK